MKVSIMLRRVECVKDGTVAGISVYSDGLMPDYTLILAPDSASANSVSKEIQKELFKIIKSRSDFELKLKELPKDTIRWLFGSRGCGGPVDLRAKKRRRELAPFFVHPDKEPQFLEMQEGPDEPDDYMEQCYEYELKCKEEEEK